MFNFYVGIRNPIDNTIIKPSKMDINITSTNFEEIVDLSLFTMYK